MTATTALRTAIIPVGLTGPQQYPLCRAIPLELLPLAGKPLIQHAMEEAALAGAERFLVLLRSDLREVQQFLCGPSEVEDQLRAEGNWGALQRIDTLKRLAGGAAFLFHDGPGGASRWLERALDFVSDPAVTILLPTDHVAGVRVAARALAALDKPLAEGADAAIACRPAPWEDTLHRLALELGERTGAFHRVTAAAPGPARAADDRVPVALGRIAVTTAALEAACRAGPFDGVFGLVEALAAGGHDLRALPLSQDISDCASFAQYQRALAATAPARTRPTAAPAASAVPDAAEATESTEARDTPAPSATPDAPGNLAAGDRPLQLDATMRVPSDDRAGT